MNSKIIDADLYSVLIHEKKSALKVSVPHDDELIDADEVQLANFAIKPRVVEEVVVA